MTLTFGPIIQQGYVVADADKAARAWAERTGVGPFYIHDIRLKPYAYRGVPTDIELRIAISYWGNIQVELIQQLSGGETLYTDFMKTSPERLNHYATVVSDLDGLLATHKLGNRVIQSGGTASGVKFVYLDQYLPDGSHLELIQFPDRPRPSGGGMEEISRHWDGRDPVRPLSAMAQDVARLKS